MRNKSAENTSQTMLQKHSQATEEQIRVAKLSQMNKDSHEEEIKMVLDITQKPLDIVSLALHDSNYDQALAISNIFEGKYDEHQWQTTSTKRGKKSTTNHTDVNGKADSIDLFNENDQKPNNTKNIARGGKGRPPRNQRDDRFSDQRRDGSEERSDMSRDQFRGTGDRGRTRGRGRGGGRGAIRGSRGGFGRGGGSSRGGRQPGRGAGRGGNKRRDGGGRREENGFGEPSTGSGFGAPGSGFGESSSGLFENPPKEEETWDVEEKTEEDWGTEETVPKTDTKLETNWGDEEMEPEIKSEKVDSLFSQKMDWGHANGSMTGEWDNKEQTISGKYVPEQIDPAVISSIPTSATSAEVTSYQPTNDISRYISNNAPSNQFPSSQQEGGLTSSLSESDFTNLTESLQQNLSSLPMISGITESHKLEQEQRNAKTHQQQLKIPRKLIPKNTVQSGQPVVMPRSAKHVHDVEEQFTGLEFGSGPVSPRLLKIANTSVTFTNNLSNTETLKNFVARQPVADLQASPVASTTPAQVSTQQKISMHPLLPVVAQSKEPTAVSETSIDQIDVSSSLSSSLNAFKSLESSGGDSKPPHYLGSPGRGVSHTLATEPIPFPPSTSLPSSPTSSSSSSLDVFSRHSGLGTSVAMTMENSQQNMSSYNDSKVYGASLSEQQQRDKTITEQRAAFAEQKALAQQKLLQSQRSKEESRSTNPINSTPPPLNSSLRENRKNISEPRMGLTETGSLQTKDKPTKVSSNDSNYPNKGHRSTNPRSISSPPGLSSSVYASNTSSKGAELLSQVTSSASVSTSKNQSKAGNAPPGMIHPNLLSYPGVQPGMLPAAYQQLHGYNNYDEILQMQRQQIHLPQSPYHYDVSTMYPTAATAAATREGIAANYQGAETKFARASGEDSTNLHQANAHVAANNINAHQAYLNAAGQLPYGFTYYQALPQGPGMYPAFTAPNVYLNQGGGKGVVGTQYQSQYAQQQSFNNAKYSGSANQDFPKGNYHNSSSSQTTLTKSGNQGGPSSDAGQSAYKVQGYNDGKGFLGSSPSSQPGMTMHGQNAQHLNHAYLLAQQQQQQVSVSQMGHQGGGGHDSRVGHQAPYGGNPQKRGGEGKGNSYQSYWSGSR